MITDGIDMMPNEMSNKEKLARMLCGTAAAFFASKFVDLVFDTVKEHQNRDDDSIE